MKPAWSNVRWYVALALVWGNSALAGPITSGLQPGQKVAPYSAIMSTGAERGRSYCYVCETGDRPAVVIFSRTLSGPLGKLVQQLDKLSEAKNLELRAWVTFLSADQLALDPKIVAWTRKLGIRSLPVGVFEDPGGPPAYHLAHDADVTILFFVKQRVIANFAFQAGELNDDQIAIVLKVLGRFVGEK